MTYFSLGMTYSKLECHEKALNDLTYVINKNSDHVNALFARAACYNTIGQFSAAIEDYNIALLKDQSQNQLRSNTSPEKVRRSSLGGSTSSPRGGGVGVGGEGEGNHDLSKFIISITITLQFLY